MIVLSVGQSIKLESLYCIRHFNIYKKKKKKIIYNVYCGSIQEYFVKMIRLEQVVNFILQYSLFFSVLFSESFSVQIAKSLHVLLPYSL